MTDVTNTVIAPPRPQDTQWAWRLVRIPNFRRDVRGTPIPTKTLSTTAANENIKGGRYPLQEEYKAKRLGKNFDSGVLFGESEGDVLWATARWFAGHYDLANRSPDACSYGLGRKVGAGELGGFVDAEEDEEAMGSTDPSGYQIEPILLRAIGPVDPHFIDLRDQGQSELVGIENRVRSIKICQQLKYRLDCNYRHVVDAVVNRCEMKAIGMAEGNKDGAASAGRMLVRAGLRTASLVRFDITRWESQSLHGSDFMISPLPDKPDVYTASQRRAANDDLRQHVRNVA